ncbi:MAG: site-specific integrase [Methanocorpusculum sp.]|nr:site-specific integrase [Methanocorpusculum sp.]
MTEQKKPRRAAGSYRKRGKDTYELRYRGESTTVTAKDDTQAERALAKFITDVDKGKFKKPAKMTVQELSVRFLRDNPDLAEPTKENYKIHLDKRILPVFEDKKIDKVTPANIYDFMDNLKEDGIREDGKPGGLSPATIQKNLHILSSMFAFAVELKELDENPCERVKPPKIPKRKKASIDRDPAREMLKALKEESLKYRCIALLGASTGMRRGEILGIGDSTLDLDSYTITVDKASRHMSGGRIPLNDPKTETSIRVIPFPPSLVPLLKEMISARDRQRKKCGDKWVDKIEVYGEMVDNDLLFTQWNGKPMHPNSVTGWFKKFKEDNKLPENLTFHGLRHTNITQLIKAGVDVGTVADMAGHAKKSTTLDYDDPDAEALREVAHKINDVLDLDNIVPGLLGQPVNIYRKKKA